MKGEGSAGWSVSVRTDGLPADTALHLTLPSAAGSITLRRLLLGELFPPDAAGQAAMAARAGGRANPDGPAVYAELRTLAEQWRSGLCRMALYSGRGWGRPAHPDDAVAAHRQGPLIGRGSDGRGSDGRGSDGRGSDGRGSGGQGSGGWGSDGRGYGGRADADLMLTMVPGYRPLDWAVAQGYASDRRQLLDWLQSCALLYLVDKHGCAVPDPAELAPGDPVGRVVAGLYRRGGLWRPAGRGAAEVAPAGRRLIGALLAETESLIDRFDLFKDARWDEEEGVADFDSGRGADLRVAAMLAEGVDPVRAVFLLRLYDGTLDAAADRWREVVSDPRYCDRLLEPVVNRVAPPPPEATLAAIMEDGYAVLEAADEAAAERRARAEIERRLRASDGEQEDEG